jgi:hypothetical protein
VTNTNNQDLHVIVSLEQLLNECFQHDKGHLPESVVAFLVGQLLQLASIEHPRWVLLEENICSMCLLVKDVDDCNVEDEGEDIVKSIKWRVMYHSKAILEYIPMKPLDCDFDHNKEYNHRLSNRMINLVALLLLGMDQMHGMSMLEVICINRYIRQKDMWSHAFRAIADGRLDRAICLLDCREHRAVVESYFESWSSGAWRQASMTMTSIGESELISLPEPRILFETKQGKEELSVKDLQQSTVQQLESFVEKYNHFLRLYSVSCLQDSLVVEENESNRLEGKSSLATESQCNQGSAIMGSNTIQKKYATSDNPVRYGKVVITVDEDSDDDDDW